MAFAFLLNLEALSDKRDPMLKSTCNTFTITATMQILRQICV